jgi:hypothetical protein
VLSPATSCCDGSHASGLMLWCAGRGYVVRAIGASRHSRVSLDGLRGQIRGQISCHYTGCHQSHHTPYEGCRTPSRGLSAWFTHGPYVAIID